jgi:hypothetical protein
VKSRKTGLPRRLAAKRSRKAYSDGAKLQELPGAQPTAKRAFAGRLTPSWFQRKFGAPNNEGVAMRCARIGLALLLVSQFQPVLATEQQKLEYVVGVESFYYPPHYYVENGRFSGYARDLLDAFAKAKGLKLTYRPLPYLRLVQDLRDGLLDFQYPDNPLWLQDKKAGTRIIYSNDAIKYIDGVSRKKENLGKPLAEFKRMVMPIGWSPIDYYPLVKAGKLEITEATNVETVLSMLSSDRVDGAYLNADVVKYIMKANGTPDRIQFDPSLPYIFSGFSLATIKHGDVIASFNQFLIDERKTVAALRQKYGFSYDTDPKGGK